MKKSVLFPLLCLFYLPLFSQMNFDEAERLMRTAEAAMRKDAYVLFPAELKNGMDKAIKVLQPEGNGEEFIIAGLLYLRSNHHFVDRNPVAGQEDLNAAKKLLQGRADSSSLDLLGSVYEMEHLDYALNNFDYSKGKMAGDSAMYYFEKAKNLVAQTRMSSNMASFEFTCFRCDESKTWVEKAEQLFNLEETQKNVDALQPDLRAHVQFVKASTSLCLADRYLFSGEYEKSQVYFDESFRLFSKVITDNNLPPFIRASLLNSQATAALFSERHIGQAGSLLTEAADLFNLDENRSQKSQVLALLAFWHFKEGKNLKQGDDAILESLERLGSPVATIYNPVVLTEKETTYGVIGTLYYLGRAYKSRFDTSLDTRDLEQGLRLFELGSVLLRRLQNAADELISFEVASSTVGRGFFSYGVETATLLYKKTGAPDFLSRALTLADQGKNFSIWRTLKGAAPLSNNGFMIPPDAGEALSVEDLRALLPDSAAAIEFVVLPRDSCFAIWATRTNAGILFLPPFREWKPFIEKFNNLLSEEDTRAPEISVKLHKMLLKPVLDKIGTGANRLFIVPDNELWNLNFDLLAEPGKGLSTSTNHRFLIERYATSYPYSLKLLNQSHKNGTSQAENHFEPFVVDYKSASSYTFCNGFQKPETLNKMEEAARFIYEQWNPEDKNKFDYCNTKACVRERLKYPGIGLMVMHGCASPDISPLQYGLALQDSVLTVEEIIQFKEIGHRLLFLGSCQSAFGKIVSGEGIACVNRAFALLGCETLVSSTIKIPDQQSAEIMQEFFMQLLKKMPADKALQAAKLKYLTNNSLALWGGLRCFGNGNVRVER